MLNRFILGTSSIGVLEVLWPHYPFLSAGISGVPELLHSLWKAGIPVLQIGVSGVMMIHCCEINDEVKC